MSSFKRSQSKYVKKQYRVRNWPEYEAGLRRRASLTVWISDEELGSWEPSKSAKKRRGGQQRYSDGVIETALTVGMVFHLPLRQTEGFLRSLFELLGSSVPVPDHSTISRRAAKLGKLAFLASNKLNRSSQQGQESGPSLVAPRRQQFTFSPNATLRRRSPRRP